MKHLLAVMFLIFWVTNNLFSQTFTHKHRVYVSKCSNGDSIRFLAHENQMYFSEYFFKRGGVYRDSFHIDSGQQFIVFSQEVDLTSMGKGLYSIPIVADCDTINYYLKGNFHFLPKTGQIVSVQRDSIIGVDKKKVLGFKVKVLSDNFEFRVGNCTTIMYSDGGIPTYWSLNCEGADNIKRFSDIHNEWHTFYSREEECTCVGVQRQ